MDKKKLMNACLVVLPLVAVLLAGMPTSVTVYYPDGEGVIDAQPVYCSFFTYIEDVPASICMPFSLICGALSFGCAAVYMVKKTAFWLKGIMGLSFVSMTLAVLPIIMRTETYIVPNMLVPILMGAVFLLAYAMIKKPQEEEKPKAKRLGDHR